MSEKRNQIEAETGGNLSRLAKRRKFYPISSIFSFLEGISGRKLVHFFYPDAFQASFSLTWKRCKLTPRDLRATAKDEG